MVLDWLVEAVIVRSVGEIVVVTGYESEKVTTHLKRSFGSRVATVENNQYSDDVNILSVEIGVSALRHPERGYLIVETDLLLDESAWDQVFAVMRHSADLSCWVCDGFYSPALTGGIVHADQNGRITAIDYQPSYLPVFDGWPKMVGLLLVGPSQVEQDRRLRRAAIKQSIAQYYLMPWKEGVASLPSRVLQLKDSFARSFNTESDFYQARADFLRHRQSNISHKNEKVINT